LSNTTSYPDNWQNELTFGIEELHVKLQNAKKFVGDNPEVNKEYQNALASITKAKEGISGFTGTFNKVYRSD
jgi:hypothetical protein